MKSMRRTLGLLSVVALVALGTACKKPAPATAPEVRPTPAPSTAPQVVAPEPTPFPSRGDDQKVEQLPNDVKVLNERGYLKDVFYEFDKADIREDQRDALAADADWLKKHTGIKFRVEGHCDERGTREYNMALGERRATASRDYLASLGVEGNRMETVSYGKERPFDPGHDESAWAKNRRAHFVITAAR